MTEFVHLARKAHVLRKIAERVDDEGQKIRLLNMAHVLTIRAARIDEGRRYKR